MYKYVNMIASMYVYFFQVTYFCFA